MSVSVDMVGSGTGTSSSGTVGSGRAHFRSQTGCCICGTKSSSSRFTASQRFAEHFGACFGSNATSRSGDLCNACVLCVKRWLQRGKQTNLFVQVLDSKKGPGPKHMKEITKRARRREAKQAAAAAKASNSRVLTKTNASNSTVPANQKSSASMTRSSSSASNTSQFMNGNSINSQTRTNTYCSKHSNATSSSLHTGHLNFTSGSSIGTRSHGLLSSTPNISSNTGSETRYHSRSLNSSVSASATSASIGYSSANLVYKPNSKSGALPNFDHRPSFSEIDDSKGATRTRAAAARQQEAFNARAAAASRLNNSIRSSTPSQTAVPNGLSPTTPSETSEYGSFGFSSRGSSMSSSSRCCACFAGDSNSNRCTHRPNQNCNSFELESHCQCNIHHHNGSSNLFNDVHSYNPDKQFKDGSSCSPCSNCCSCCCLLNSSPCSCSLHYPIQCCTSEFRHPSHLVPQSVSSVPNGASLNLLDTDTQSNSSQLSPTSSVTTNTTGTTRRYNRRVVLPPVKMTPNPELDSLLRDIMERNSQAINYDSREMHMAVQRCLRLRSRTIQAASASGSASGRASSISSADGSIDAVMSTNSQLGSAKTSSNGPVDSVDTGLGRSSSSLIGSDDCPPSKRHCGHICSHQTDLTSSQSKTTKLCCPHSHHHHHCHHHHHHQQQQRQRQPQQTQPDSLPHLHSLPHHQLRHSRLSFQPYSTPNPRKS